MQSSVRVVVEILLGAGSRAKKQQVKEHALLQLSRKTMFCSGADADLKLQLAQFGVEQVLVSLPSTLLDKEIAYFRASVEVFVYRLNAQPAHEEQFANEHDGTSTTLFSHYLLPSREMEGIWENLVLVAGVKEKLVNYSSTSLLFSKRGVDPNQVCCNRVFLFHGPPGSGKTSLCQALAQKLSVRHARQYPNGFHLLKVNSSALFSRFFSESGKLVNKLFEAVRELAADTDALVILLIDEVESLTSTRSKVSAADPSDAVRVVNAMLTQIDRLRTVTNVMLFCTSNLTDLIDPAFMDRADVKLYLGNPDSSARYQILSSCLDALVDAGVVEEEGEGEGGEVTTTTTDWLWRAAQASSDMSGRALRKMPFQAHAFYIPDAAATTRADMAQAFFRCIEDAAKT